MKKLNRANLNRVGFHTVAAGLVDNCSDFKPHIFEGFKKETVNCRGLKTW